MKLLALCPCEKVIVDKQGAHSLINLMLNAEIQLPQTEQMPPNAVVPTAWFIYSLWMPSSDDVGKTFDQVYQVYWPSGEKFTENRIELKQQDENASQVTLGLVGFPVGQKGKLRIITWLDYQGHRVSEVLEMNVNVKHQPNIAPISTAT